MFASKILAEDARSSVGFQEVTNPSLCLTTKSYILHSHAVVDASPLSIQSGIAENGGKWATMVAKLHFLKIENFKLGLDGPHALEVSETIDFITSITKTTE